METFVKLFFSALMALGFRESLQTNNTQGLSPALVLLGRGGGCFSPW